MWQGQTEAQANTTADREGPWGRQQAIRSVYLVAESTFQNGSIKTQREGLSRILRLLLPVRWAGDLSQRLATGWTVLGSNPGGGEIFRTCPDRPRSPRSLLYKGYRVFPRGKERPGCDADPSHTFQCRGQERVELYLYSLYGPHGLYRSSEPVQGCTFLPPCNSTVTGHCRVDFCIVQFG